MKRSTILGIIIGGVIVVVGGFAFLWFAGGSGEPSTSLTTPEIAADTTAGPADSADTTAPDALDTTEGLATSSTGAKSYVIAAGGDSVATFEIDEELRGQPVRVVGTTAEVAGQFAVDVSDLSTAQFSDLVVNARTFVTDSERRDRAIRGPVILNSSRDEFEFISVSLASIDGLSGSLEPGGTVEFSVTGDMTVRGTTNTETFDVTATLVDEDTIEGTASTIVLRSNYGIGIPNVPGVANVADEVTLILDFVAVAS